MSRENEARIRQVSTSDAGAIAQIYNQYIEETVITFEEVTVSREQIAQRIEHILGLELPWLVAVDSSNSLQGYAYAAPWRERSAYRHSVEVSIYLDPKTQGKGIGTKLYQKLFDILSNGNRVHAAMAGIALPNEVSIALHEKFGMHKVAHLSEVGFKFGRWIDVAYWQRLFKSS